MRYSPRTWGTFIVTVKFTLVHFPSVAPSAPLTLTTIIAHPCAVTEFAKWQIKPEYLNVFLGDKAEF